MMEEKIFPDSFYQPFFDDCSEYREFTNNVCSYQFAHKFPLSGEFCGKVYIEYYYNYGYNSTCSHECYVKYSTIFCIICQKSFLKTNVNSRRSPFFTLLNIY